MQVLFAAGAVVDAVAAVILLSSVATAALFGREPHAPDPDLLLMRGYAASLMAGWTALLVWAAFDPVRRALVGPLTAAPVLVGLAATEAVALARGFVDPAHVGLILSLQLLFAVVWCVVYRQVRTSRVRVAHER